MRHYDYGIVGNFIINNAQIINISLCLVGLFICLYAYYRLMAHCFKRMKDGHGVAGRWYLKRSSIK